ncbi:MAG: glycosyltransferase family 2 protein [Candidatus Thalassarchaeaceae archaeon]|nr:glycosyltransferase family 2 protein [Candidatus Thalassarchaeaceae archaeon]
MSDGPLISLTVCMRDAEQWVDHCLESLVKQTYRPLEIIAVDDGSTDGGYVKLKAWEGEHNGITVRVLKQSPTGLSAGRNLALEHSKGEWVAITDIDCRPDPYWISEMYLVSEGLEDEQVLAVTGRTIFDEGDTAISRLRARSIARKYSSRPRLTSLANGPCSMFERKALINVGGFDPKWYHAEDMEVSLRLLQTGGVIVHSPTAVVHHVAESSLRLFLFKRCRDARAHMRIRRRFGRHGVRKPNGYIHLHDFVSDAKDVVWMLPIAILGLGLAVALMLSLPQQDFLWWVAVSTAGFWCLLYISRWHQLLWSGALWFGAFLGTIDALLGRHGHQRILQREE